MSNAVWNLPSVIGRSIKCVKFDMEIKLTTSTLVKFMLSSKSHGFIWIEMETYNTWKWTDIFLRHSHNKLKLPNGNPLVQFGLASGIRIHTMMSDFHPRNYDLFCFVCMPVATQIYMLVVDFHFYALKRALDRNSVLIALSTRISININPTELNSIRIAFLTLNAPCGHVQP